MTPSSSDTLVPIRRRKLLPPSLKGSLIPRPRLLSRLDLGLELPLTLVIAPAGYGKTTLVRQWAERQSIPVAWLTLDPGDADGRRFVTHLLTAIAAVAPIDTDHMLELLRASRGADGRYRSHPGGRSLRLHGRPGGGAGRLRSLRWRAP